MRRIAAGGIVLLLAAGLFLGKQAPALALLPWGWWNVLRRVAPQVEINIAGIATAVVCVAVIVFLLHRVGVWLYAEVRAKHQRTDWPTAWRWSWTLCLLATIVLLFIAGLAGVGLFRTTVWFLEPDTQSLLVSSADALAFGWFRYPMRLAGTHELDGPNTLLCLACLAGLTAGVHAFGRWFAGQRPALTAWPPSRTLTLVGLVLLMFVAGITAIGILHETVWLVRAALRER